MKLKLQLADANPQSQTKKHPTTCLDWSSIEEIYSAGDDNELLSWSVSQNASTKIASLPRDCHPTDIQFLHSKSSSQGGGAASGKQLSDLILLTTANGRFHIMNRNGRIERTVEAHKGAVLVGQWGYDAASILTGGEDGCLKIWSRSGMLRSTLVASDNSVYGACWSPDNESVAYTHGKCISIKALAPNTKPLKWKAHDSLVICLAWSTTANQLLVSGSEDCRYKVWTSDGHVIFSSGLHSSPVTAVSWSPNGQLIAVGAYDTIRVCDYAGWCRCMEHPSTGTIYKLAWSKDGTQLGAACANSNILIGHIVDRRSSYAAYTATLTERKVITIRTVLDESIVEQLELPERVIQFELRYNHLVVTTPGQCYIYSTSNWNTPYIFDLKDTSVNLLLLIDKHLLLIETHSLGLYNYHGRLIGSPRWPNMRLDTIRSTHITLSSDLLAVRDSLNTNVIHLVDISGTGGRTAASSSSLESSQIQHSTEVIEIALNQWSCSTIPKGIALLDRMRDLYLVSAEKSSTARRFFKLGRKTESFQWNTEDNMIAAIQDNQLIVWYCPQAAFDSALLKFCTLVADGEDLGRTPRIQDFVGNAVQIRRADGALITIPVSPLPSTLYNAIQKGKWNEAIDLCRTTNDRILWTCLAAMATFAGTEAMHFAEEAYSRLDHYTKVAYIQDVKLINTKIVQKSHMILLTGAIEEAESILLQGGQIFQAIYMNLKLYNWNRALQLATKYKSHIDCVLYMRRKYLESLEQSETNNQFLNLKEMEINVNDEKVLSKFQSELDKLRN